MIWLSLSNTVRAIDLSSVWSDLLARRLGYSPPHSHKGREGGREGRSDCEKTIYHLCLMTSEGCPPYCATGNWPRGQRFNYICKERQRNKKNNLSATLGRRSSGGSTSSALRRKCLHRSMKHSRGSWSTRSHQRPSSCPALTSSEQDYTDHYLLHYNILSLFGDSW